MVSKIVIFGAGLGGERALRWLKTGRRFDVIAYSDNDETKWNRDLNGLRVIPPGQILNMGVDRVLIASVYSAEIHSQLVKMGYPPDRIDVLESDILEGISNESSPMVYVVAVVLLLIFALAGYGLYRLVFG